MKVAYVPQDLERRKTQWRSATDIALLPLHTRTSSGAGSPALLPLHHMLMASILMLLLTLMMVLLLYYYYDYSAT